jgi:triphosphoribosyl-dephospho-CoA synthase
LTFEIAVPALAVDIPIRDAIVDAHLRLLDAAPDTLIARKRGADAAARVSAGAREVLAAGGVRSAAGREALQRFDASLRSPDNALNPGTTADLVTAAIFVALVEGMV